MENVLNKDHLIYTVYTCTVFKIRQIVNTFFFELLTPFRV